MYEKSFMQDIVYQKFAEYDVLTSDFLYQLPDGKPILYEKSFMQD